MRKKSLRVTSTVKRAVNKSFFNPFTSQSSFLTAVKQGRCDGNKKRWISSCTSSKVGEVVGCHQDGGTVPAPVGEQFLADVDDLTGGSDDDRHQFQITTTYQTLVLLQTHRPSVGAVCRPVPERLLPPASQRSVTTQVRAIDMHCRLNQEHRTKRHTTIR